MLEFYGVILIPVILVAVVITFLFVITGSRNNGDREKKRKKSKYKDKNTLIKESNRRLAQNPKDSEALLSLAHIHFQDGNYDKAMRSFEILIELCATNKELDEFDITMKYALSCLEIKRTEEAYKAFLICRSMKTDSFQVNYNLGILEYKRKSYEKAALLLNQARKDHPEHAETIKYLGHTLYKLKRFKEASMLLRKSMDLEPNDKESLFMLGQTYNEIGHNEQAVKIFSHLRPDPVIGPKAALFAGTLHLNGKQYEKAIMDFEIGLRHENIPADILLEMKYRLASIYIRQQEIGKALTLLEEIRMIKPDYKDTGALINQYRELHHNQNLQTYLISATSDFVVLCRKLAADFFSQAKVKVTDVSVYKNEYADILVEVSTKKWDDIVLFRFVRTNGQVGELILRDLYTKIKEVKAGRGFCLTAGKFSEGAVQFVEARLIDLIEKDELLERLNKVGNSAII